jgi:hypothetical protein
LVFFLLTAGSTRHIKFSKSSLDILKKLLNLDRSSPLSPTSLFHKSTSSWSPSYSFHLLNVGLTENRLFPPPPPTPLMFLVRGI